jgi:hypothetical protein
METLSLWDMLEAWLGKKGIVFGGCIELRVGHIGTV